jgi:hypothetical protein
MLEVNNVDLDKLAQEWKEAGAAKGLTSWRQIAGVMGVDNSLLTKTVAYKRPPTIPTVQKSARALAPEKEAEWLILAGYDLVPSSGRLPQPIDLEHLRVNLRASGKLSPETIDVVVETIKEIEESDKTSGS